MRVRPLTPRDLPGLHARFRLLCAPIRHGFSPGYDEFAEPLAAVPPHLADAEVLVAERADVPLAFVRVGVALRVSRWTLASAGDTLLFGPFCLPQDAEAGACLLSYVVDSVRARSSAPIWAFDPCEAASMPAYNGGVALLSEQLPHVARILAAQGFRVQHRELCMELANPPRRAPSSAPAGLSAHHGEREGETTVALTTPDGQPVGECRYSLMNPRRSRHPAARTTGYIDALCVADRFQGRGLGRWLLAEALRDLAEMGAASVRLTTGAQNVRAQGLYYSVGFALAGSCIALKRP